MSDWVPKFGDRVRDIHTGQIAVVINAQPTAGQMSKVQYRYRGGPSGFSRVITRGIGSFLARFKHAGSEL